MKNLAKNEFGYNWINYHCTELNAMEKIVLLIEQQTLGFEPDFWQLLANLLNLMQFLSAIRFSLNSNLNLLQLLQFATLN